MNYQLLGHSFDSLTFLDCLTEKIKVPGTPVTAPYLLTKMDMKTAKCMSMSMMSGNREKAVILS